MNVRFTRRAQKDLDSIQEFLSQRSISGAANVTSAINRATKNIRTFPRGGRLAGHEHVRVLPVGNYPYLIYWEIAPEEVRIVHIRHTSRVSWEGGTENE